MRSLYFKEIKTFFSSLVGYVVLLLFVIATGLLLWVLPETNILPNANILDYGYASMEQFFAVAPIVLTFLIPALTMRSFADEYKTGAIEWLFTKPLKLREIILGKYLAALTLAVIALIPTLIYLISLNWLAITAGSLDFGGIMGSYIGLFLLTATFVAIGIFSSSVTDSQIVSFLMALALNFVLYSGFEGLSRIKSFRGGADYYLELMGLDYHYTNISRGVIDTRDVVYFLSLIFLFLVLNRYCLIRKKQ